MSKLIASFGGGVDSTAMIIKMTRGGVLYDAILFADTGGEKPETYSFISVFNAWLLRNNQTPITFVKYSSVRMKKLTLEQDILNNKTLPAIAFGFKTCSQKFKIQPQIAWIKRNFRYHSITMHIGYDTGEIRRAKPNPEKGFSNEFPLILMGLTRERCEEIITEEGLPVPPKSSCFFCPNMKKKEILALPENLKDRVLNIEKNAIEGGKLIELKGLGRTYSWSDLINSDRNGKDLETPLAEYDFPCECID